MEKGTERGLEWAGLPVIATVARLLSPCATQPLAMTPSRGGSRSRGCPGPVTRDGSAGWVAVLRRTEADARVSGHGPGAGGPRTPVLLRGR